MSASRESSSTVAVPPTYLFGGAEVDPVACELRVNGKAEPLEPKAFDLLLYLIRNRGRVVGMDELLREVWPDVRVSSSVVRRCVVLVRRALGEASPEDPIKTVARRGYRFIADVEERAPEAPDPPTTGRSAPERVVSPGASVIGRTREVAQLSRALGLATDGQGTVCVLAGEAGIGKSHVAQVIAKLAKERGLLVLSGRAYERGGAPAFWPWTQVLRAYLAKRPDDLDSLAAIDPLLVSILPELRPAANEGRAPTTESPERDRFQLFDGVGSVLRHVTDEMPALMILEDLHWADAATVELVRFLVPTVRTSRLLVLVTIRNEVWNRGHPLEPSFRALSADPACEFLRLRGLAENELGELLAMQLGKMPPREWLHEAWEKTGGNPFFAREVAALFTHEEELHGASWGTKFRIPERVRDALLRRVAPLPTESREALDTAALIGVEFDVARLAAVLEVTTEETLRRLAPAEAVGVVVEADGGQGGYRFSHALVPETLRADLPGIVRLPRHRKIADILVSRGEPEIEGHLDEIAHHYAQAASLGVAAEAKSYCERAGDHAMELFGYEKAESMYDLALGISERYAPEALAARAELLMKKARAAQGRAAPDVELRSSLRQAAELAERAGASELLAQAAIAYAGNSEFMDPFWRLVPESAEERRDLLERALARCTYSSPRTRATLHMALAGVSLGSRPLDELLALLRDARRSASEAGDSQLEAELLASEAHVLADAPERLDERYALIERAIRSFDRGPPAVLRDCHGLRAGLLAERGRFAEADAGMMVFESDAAARRKPLARAPLLAWRAMRASMEGRFAASRALTRELEGAASGILTGVAEVVLVQRWKLALLDGRFDDIPDATAFPQGSTMHEPAWRAARARHALVFGHRERAVELFRELSKHDFRDVPGEVWISTMAMIADVASEVGDPPMVRSLYERMLPFSGRFVVLGNLIACDGSIDRVLGRLAARLGRLEEAGRHFASALEANLEVGAHPWVALTEVDLARHHLVLGERGRAEELLERARQAALSLDMPSLLAILEGVERS